MKWAGMYFFGFVLLIGGILAALWKLGILQTIETTWIVIGVVILAGVGIMVSVANSGTKENIEIDRISLFRQDDVDARFRIIGDWPLSTA